MDIEMITDGNSTAREICANNFDTIIIYISSYTSYFQELFDVEPFRFIQKPIKKDIFSSYLSLAVKRVLSGRQVYPFHFCKAFYAIPIKEIVYFESRLHIIIIHCENNNSYQYGKLNNIENTLNKNYPPFLMIHQSFLVNLHYIRSINYTKVTLHDNTVLNISENRRKKFRNNIHKSCKTYNIKSLSHSETANRYYLYKVNV